MHDERDAAATGPDDTLPSLEHVSQLAADRDRLVTALRRHNATITRFGGMSAGAAPTARTSIAVRVEHGRVLVLGVRETV